MPYISGALMLVIIILQSLQEAHGVPTGNISFQNQFEALFNLSYSPIIEEIGFRATPIGTLIGLLVLKHAKFGYLKRVGYIALSFTYPEHVKRRLALPNISKSGILHGLTIYEWILVLSSSIFFGLAHYLFGGGWNIGKISSAALAGTVLSLVFLWKGLPACVLLHWFFNYFGYVFNVAQKTISSTFSTVTSFIDISILISGILGIIVLSFIAMDSLIKVFKR